MAQTAHIASVLIISRILLWSLDPLAKCNVEAAISCDQVLVKISSCLSYLQSGGDVSFACCAAIKAVKNAANTTSDRQLILPPIGKYVCKCLITAASKASNISKSRISGLPDKCGVFLPYKISPQMNCSVVP